MANHYQDFDKYVKKTRWMSYWHQVKEVLDTHPKNVLLIGIGNGIIPAILREKGIDVYTFDYDEKMSPDFCGDLRNIQNILSEYKFDTILCCQVLEHLEFEYFSHIISFFNSIVNKNVIISLPHCHIAFSCWIRVPILKNIECKLIIPSFWIKECFFNMEHKWEIGMKNYSKKKIKKIISEIYEIQNIYHVTTNPYHLFYILRKKGCKNEDLFNKPCK